MPENAGCCLLSTHLLKTHITHYTLALAENVCTVNSEHMFGEREERECVILMMVSNGIKNQAKAIFKYVNLLMRFHSFLCVCMCRMTIADDRSNEEN